jgi:hypothetical protein
MKMNTSLMAPEPAVAAVVGELIRHLLSDSRPAAAALVNRLDDAVRVYEVEFRGFLNGQGHRPPFALGAALATAFQELGEAPERRRALGFRLEALEARFHAAERLFTQRLERPDRRMHAPLLRAS